MRLMVIRHGKAERDSDTGRDDDRRLAPRGERQAEGLAQWLGECDRPPELICASPVERARRTASILAGGTGIELRIDDRLSTDAAPSDCVELIESASGLPALALVGHNPTLENLVGILVGGTAGGDRRLRTGEAAILDIDADAPVGSGDLIEMVRFDD